MRVAHVADGGTGAAGGVAAVIAQLCHHLPRAGVAVEVWALSARATAVETTQVAGVPWHVLPGRALAGQVVPRRAARAFVRARQGQVDLLHLHSVFRADNLALARLGIPYVVTPHGGYAARRRPLLKRLWLTAMERRYLRRAAAVQALAAPEAAALHRIHPAIRTVCIGNGVGPELLDHPRSAPGGSDLLLYLGRIAVQQKGLDLLLHGYADALARAPDLPALTLAGPDFRDGAATLWHLAAALGIAGRIRLPGPASSAQAHALMARARLFIHTSRHEGQPLAVLEAMALGRPVLVTPPTNLADAVSRAAAGFVADAAPAAIAASLLAAHRTLPAELDAMGRNARALVARTHVWPGIARRMAALYRRAGDGPPHAPTTAAAQDAPADA